MKVNGNGQKRFWKKIICRPLRMVLESFQTSLCLRNLYFPPCKIHDAGLLPWKISTLPTKATIFVPFRERREMQKGKRVGEGKYGRRRIVTSIEKKGLSHRVREKWWRWKCEEEDPIFSKSPLEVFSLPLNPKGMVYKFSTLAPYPIWYWCAKSNGQVTM